MKRYRAGQWTAVFLMFLTGTLLLADEWLSVEWNYASSLWRVWPIALVLFGVEVLVAGKRQAKVRYSLGGAFIVVFLLIGMELYSLITTH
ncbi:MAG: hypothetical protein K6T85_02305 [Gorillibacterium sp.]|nr:hypothetical protein [Gorillibacterium sp.]